MVKPIMDAYVPPPNCPTSLILMSGDDGGRHPENVKSDFVTTLAVPVDLHGQYGVSLESLEYNTRIINFVEEPGGYDTDVVYTPADVGGIHTPWLDVGGQMKKKKPYLQTALVKMVYYGTMKSDTEWYRKTPLLEYVFDVDVRNVGDGHYDCAKFSRQINRRLADSPVINTRPPFPTIDEDHCTYFNILNKENEPLDTGIPLEAVLNKWPSFERFVNEFLDPYVKFTTTNNFSMLFATKANYPEESLGHVVFFGNTHDQCHFVLSQSRLQSDESFDAMLHLFGFGHLYTPFNNGPLKSAVGRTIKTTEFLFNWVSPNLAGDRVVPPEYEPFGFGDMGLVQMRIVDESSSSTVSLFHVPFNDLVAATDTAQFIDRFFNNRVPDTLGLKMVIRWNDTERKIVLENRLGIQYRVYINCKANAFLGDYLGLGNTPGVTSEVYFDDYDINTPISTKISFDEFTADVEFADEPTMPLSSLESLADYVNALPDHEDPTRLKFEMKKSGSLHGFYARMTENGAAAIIGDGASITIRADGPFTNTHTIEVGETHMDPTYQPKSSSALLTFRTLMDIMDPRDVRRRENASVFIRGYQMLNTHFPLKQQQGFVKRIEFTSTLTGPAAYKTPQLLKDAINRAIKKGLRNVDPKWTKYRARNLKRGADGETRKTAIEPSDIVNIEWLEGEYSFDITCGDSLDYVEVAISPLLAELLGFEEDNEALLRLVPHSSHSVKEYTDLHETLMREGVLRVDYPHSSHSVKEYPDLTETIMREGIRWLDYPLTLRADETDKVLVHTSISGIYPVSLSKGINNIFIHLDIVGQTQYIGGRRQNIVGMVPIKWDAEGNDVHTPLHQNPVPITTNRISGVRMELLDWKGDRIKFTGNDSAAVIAAFTIKRMGT